MGETIILDPPAVATTRDELDITGFVGREGPNWGDATIAAYMSDGVIGSRPIDYRIPNRIVSIPLNLLDHDGITFDALRMQLQQLVGLWQDQGGWLQRTVNGDPIYLDVVDARLRLGGSSAQAMFGLDTDAVLELETLPDWYGNETADTTDDFTTLQAAWTFDAGAGTLSSSGGVLVASTTAIKRLYRTDVAWRDDQVTVAVTTGGSLLAFEAGVIVKRIDANNYVRVTLSYNGSTASLGTTYVVAGRTIAGSSIAVRIATGTTYFIRGRIQGNAIAAELFTTTPTLGSTPANAAAVTTLTGANATALGLGVLGEPGIYWDASGGAAGVTLDNLTIEPNVYVERTVGELLTAPMQVNGNFPRGNRCRLIVAEAQGANQKGILGAFRSRFYDSAATSALTFEAEALTPLDIARSGSLSGASGNVITYAGVPQDWTPMLQLGLLSGAYFTHIGTYRLIARVQSNGPMQFRCLYDVGDLVAPTINDPWTVPAPASGGLFYADLGELRLDRCPVGAHRWTGQIQAKGLATATDTAWIDRIILVPVDEWEATATAIVGANNSIPSIPARDSFAQAGRLALAGLTADVGGTWSGAGSATDFTTTGSAITRAAISDTSLLTGRFAVLGAALTDQTVKANVTAATAGAFFTGDRFGLLLRYVDARNFAFAGWSYWNGGSFEFMVCIAGTIFIKSYNADSTFWSLAASGYVAQATVDADGNFDAGYYLGSTYISMVTGYDFNLATGGTLASGKAGIYDCHENATAETRTYDNFKVTVTQSDAAVYARLLAELRTDGMFRQDVTGSAYAKISQPLGQLPRIPCSGTALQPVEGLVVASRGDFDTLPDTAIDDLAVQVLWRPCWLFTPDPA